MKMDNKLERLIAICVAIAYFIIFYFLVVRGAYIPFIIIFGIPLMGEFIMGSFFSYRSFQHHSALTWYSLIFSSFIYTTFVGISAPCSAVYENPATSMAISRLIHETVIIFSLNMIVWLYPVSLFLLLKRRFELFSVIIALLAISGVESFFLIKYAVAQSLTEATYLMLFGILVVLGTGISALLMVNLILGYFKERREVSKE